MDEDTFSRDDFAGAATYAIIFALFGLRSQLSLLDCLTSINVGDLITLGAERGVAELPSSRYNVVLADGTYRGDIRVAVVFRRKVISRTIFHSLALRTF